MQYVQAENLDGALRLLGDDINAAPIDQNAPGINHWAILSGGTDFYPSSYERPMARRILDIHALEELKQIDISASRVSLGAGVTWSDVIKADLPPAFDALKLAAREVGSVQIQNKATLVGNLCNASPAADGVPPLLSLNAKVQLTSLEGVREIPLSEFILGNRKTARRPNELVTAILIPSESTTGHSTFLKLGARKYLVISISMVAVRLSCDQQGIIREAAVSVGSCSLVAQRLHQLEKQLMSQSVNSDLAVLLTNKHIECLAPIDDVRSTAHYREIASLELIKRALNTVGSSFS